MSVGVPRMGFGCPGWTVGGFCSALCASTSLALSNCWRCDVEVSCGDLDIFWMTKRR